MDLQFKAVPFEIKAAAADGKSFSGDASIFFNVDTYREIVDDAAFNMDIVEFLSDGFVGGLNHQWDDPIGVPTVAVPTKTGLSVTAELSDTTHAVDVRKMLTFKPRPIVKKLSIGYQTLGVQQLETLDDVQAYWQSKGYAPSAQDISRAQFGATLLTRLKLYEFSPVVTPANDRANITAVKMRAAKALQDCIGEACHCTDETPDSTPANVRELEKFLRDAGLPSEKAKACISMAKSVLLRDAKDDDAGNPPEDDGQPPAAASADTPPPPSETPAGEAEKQAATADTAEAPEDPPAPTQSPSEEVPAKAAPKPLPDDLLPETAAKRVQLTAMLHAQFLDIQDRASRWCD